MTTPSTEYDVVVIGGGPAGSTVSTLIADRGYSIGLFERERFPRFHIGESLIPETYWVLKRLGMLGKMQRSHFVKKYSVQFVNASGKLSAPFYFWDNTPHECSQTSQVVRSEFDQMMLDNAREHGVNAFEGVHVLEVLFEGERAVGVRIKDADGTRREIRAKVVVDALKSGELAADAIVDGLQRGIRVARSLERGAPISTKVSIGCAVSYANTTTVSVSANSWKAYPVQGTITDLLIGDLFTDRVDKVWGPMESMYRHEIPSWTAGATAEASPEKSNELVLPDGPRR